jgi:hypothetical protein
MTFLWRLETCTAERILYTNPTANSISTPSALKIHSLRLKRRIVMSGLQAHFLDSISRRYRRNPGTEKWHPAQ